MVQVGFRGKFEHAAASLRHVCKHKELVPATNYVACADPAGPFLTAARIIKCQKIILMADCDPEKIMCL